MIPMFFSLKLRLGFSMILALVVTGVAVAMIVAGFSYISFAQQSGLLQRQQIASLGLGYGGLNQAIAELRRNPDYTGGFVGQSSGLSSGEYRIFVSDYGPNKLVSVRTYTPSQAHLLRSCRLYQAIYSPARQTLVQRSFQELNEPGCRSTATPSPIATPAVSPSVSPTATVTSSAAPTATPSVSPSASAAPSPSPTASPTITPTPTSTLTPTPSPSSGNGQTGSLRFFIDLGPRADDVATFGDGLIFAYAPTSNLPTGHLFKNKPVRDRTNPRVFVVNLEPFNSYTIFQPSGIYCLEIDYRFRVGSQSAKDFGLGTKTTYTDKQSQNGQVGFFTLGAQGTNQAVRGEQIKDRGAGDSTCPRNLR